MDLFYIETYDGACSHMPIDRFEKSEVIRIVKGIMSKNPNAEIKVNSRDYRTLKMK